MKRENKKENIMINGMDKMWKKGKEMDRKLRDWWY